MKFARMSYGIAAIYGIVTLVPLYFLIGKVGRDAPPSITHPEFYYGFVGLALLWQLVFILIAKDPIRYLPIMPITILEKAVYTVPVLMLCSVGQVHKNIVLSSLADPVFGVLFIVAYLKVRNLASERTAS